MNEKELIFFFQNMILQCTVTNDPDELAKILQKVYARGMKEAINIMESSVKSCSDIIKEMEREIYFGKKKEEDD